MTVIPLPVPAERRLTPRRQSASHPASRRARHAASDAGWDAASDAGVPEADAIEAAAPETQTHETQTHETQTHVTQTHAEISGTFTSPTGRVGRMTGQARVRQIRVEEEQGRATVVFTGQLCDADGSAIGTGSRRAMASAATAEGLHGRAAVIGPVEVDLLGLAVSIHPFVVGADVPPWR